MRIMKELKDNKLFFNSLLTLFMAIVCTSQGCISENEPQGTALSVGDSLPLFSVILNDGTLVDNSSLEGKVAVIVFFNTGCSDCRKEFPVIQMLWELYKDNPEVVIAPIAREESEEDIASYWEANGLTMPYSPQENRDVYNLFAPSIIPRIYITGRNGIILFSSGDADMPDLEKLKTEVTKALSTE